MRVRLMTIFGNSSLLTATVPQELYSAPGIYEVYLLDKLTNQKSDSRTFMVE